MNDSIQLLTPAEAAMLLRVTTARLARWRSEGRGPKWRKVGGSARYEFADLNDFLQDANRVPA